MEVYIDDVVMKSHDFDTHLGDLDKGFIRKWKHQFKMNPLKCAIGVSRWNFLGFLVHQWGIGGRLKLNPLFMLHHLQPKKTCRDFLVKFFS